MQLPVSAVKKQMVATYLLGEDEVLSTPAEEVASITSIDRGNGVWNIRVDFSLNASDAAAGIVVGANGFNGDVVVMATDDLSTRPFAALDSGDFAADTILENGKRAILITVPDAEINFVKAALVK